MNAREKVLAGVVGGLVGVFVVGYALYALINKPLKEIDKRTAVLREKLEKVKAEKRGYFAAEDQVKAMTLRTFADTIDQASAKSGEMLTRTILSSGLQEMEFTRLPLGPRRLKGANEIGWSVQGEGPLASVVNLVFQLQESPWLHRIESLTVTAGDVPGAVRLRFRYLTLVMDPAPEVQRTELAVARSIDSNERRLLDSLVDRDILRPYIKRPPPPAPPPASGGTPSASPGGPAAPPGPESFRIVSLSEWQGQPEIHVRDMVNQKTARYKPGDSLAGGTVVMVDYRPLPMPGNSGLQSFSRVLLKIGTEFWAIERGKTLADKRRLVPSEFPAELANK
jgi:hypothetical protein